MNKINERTGSTQEQEFNITFTVGSFAVATILVIGFFRGDDHNSGVMTVFLAMLSAEGYRNYVSMKKKLFLISSIVAGIGTLASLASFILYK